MTSLWVPVLISLIIALPLVVWIYAGTINPSLEDSLRASARFNAQEIASIINILQASPEGTQHNYAMPALKCTIIIDSRINVTIEERFSHVTDYIRSSVAVEKREFLCDGKREKTLAFSRERNKISISG